MPSNHRISGKLPKQPPEIVAEEANEEEKAHVDAPNPTTAGAAHHDEDHMDQTDSEQVSEPQSDGAMSRLREFIAGESHVEKTIPLSNPHDLPSMDGLDSKDTEMCHDSSTIGQVAVEDNKKLTVDPQGESNPTECEEAVTITSVDTFSIKVTTDSAEEAQECLSATPPADSNTIEVADHTDIADTGKRSVDVTNASAKTRDVQVEIPINHFTELIEGKKAESAKLSPLKESNPASTAAFDIELTADVSSIAEELLKPPVSPISPAESPTKERVPAREELNNDSQDQIRTPLQSENSVGKPDVQTTTPTKTDTEELEEPDPADMTTDITAEFTTELTSQFDDDKDRLKAFIQRTKQEKANKAANITRRESLQNRRDSDAVRRALASPRPALEEKDANVSSPTREPSLQNISKVLESAISDVEEREAAQPTAPASAEDDAVVSPSLRRSTRKQSRIPQLPTAAAAAAQQRTPKKISVRRTDGNETLILAQKKEAQELANLTRVNTRKNKAAAVPATMRLAQLAAESLAVAFNGVNGLGVLASPAPVGEKGAKEGERKGQRRKSVRWDEERLTSFRAAPVFGDEAGTAAKAQGAAASLGPAQAKKSTSRVRRLKGLGASNGTPAKGLLASTLLPDEVAEQKAAEQKEAEEKTKDVKAKESGKGNKTNEKKSRLAPPKKLELKPSIASVTGGVVLEGKENAAAVGRLVSPKKAGAGRGMIPVPATTTGVSGFGVMDGVGAQPARKRVRKM